MQTRMVLNKFYKDKDAGRGFNAIRCSEWWLAMLFPLILAGCAGVGGLPATPETSPLVSTRVPRIGLALGGGAAKGFAHVGVIAVLEEAGLRPSYIVGTSAGSLVAALYASGKSSAELQKAALAIEEVAITDWMLPLVGRGMFRGDALGRYVNEAVGGRLLDQMSIPLGVVATDLGNGQAMLFRRERHALARYL